MVSHGAADGVVGSHHPIRGAPLVHTHAARVVGISRVVVGADDQPRAVGAERYGPTGAVLVVLQVGVAHGHPGGAVPFVCAHVNWAAPATSSIAAAAERGDTKGDCCEGEGAA